MIGRAILLGCVMWPAAAWAGARARTLLEFGRGFNVADARATDAKVSRASGGRLRIATGHKARWPGVTFEAPGGKWDLSRHLYVELDVRNVGPGPVTVHCHVGNPGADGRKRSVMGMAALAGGGSGTVTVRLLPTPWRLSRPLELVGMRGWPGQASPLDASNVTQVMVFVTRPTADHVFEIGALRATGAAATLKAETFLPFVDEFGQFIHGNWPGKTHSTKDLAAAARREQADLAAHPHPVGWNQYGGWTAGPQLKATGFFRAEKYRGKWWLVDPSGRLFWSHGIDCVNSTSAATPVTDRENYFRQLPGAGDPGAEFYGRSSWAPRGYYEGKAYRTFNFHQANLLRRYGPNWPAVHVDLTHRRLRSWGLNTLGNWSSREYYGRRKTPYVVAVHFRAPPIEGSQGFWKKFPDVFDAGFAAGLRRYLADRYASAANDPWCVGFFVDNELSWGSDTSLAAAVLISPPGQAAKKAFAADLKAKYKTVARLNAAWGTKHASWDALLAATDAPKADRAQADLKAFNSKIAETYFRICRDEVRRIAPKNMYLGCRFAWRNDMAVLTAAKFCDVVSFNWYRDTPGDFRLPGGVDMPVIIGEFHFGALDRGMFHTGLVRAASQNDRAAMYERYVRDALRHPQLVGTHWFQYADQALTGRGDGENYQIGFVDVCDTVYHETVAACRRVGYGMYQLRMKD